MARKSRGAMEREREIVLEIIRNAPEGLRQAQIRAAYAEKTRDHLPYMTLRARLGELLATDEIARSPRRRDPRYLPVRKNASTETAPETRQTRGEARQAAPETMSGSPDGETTELAIPLSTAARAAHAAVIRPRLEKRPVTYDIDFLDAYKPGSIWYLPAALRDRLQEIGRTAYANQPAGTYARDIMQRLIIDLSWGSSRLEGNKYSRIDTEELLREGKAAEGASDRDRQMILNHKSAIEFLVENAQQIGFDRYTVLGLHALLAENLLSDPDEEGRLRVRPIGIGDSVYTPTAIPQVIEERFDIILNKAAAIPDPMEQAFFVMVHFPYLQPFIDVNKRTSRLAANIPLIRANLCPLSFVDVPERTYTEGMLAVYEQRDVSLLRDVFVWAYERSCAQFKVLRQSLGDPDPIRLRYRTELRALVAEMVREQRWPGDADLHAFAVRYRVGEADREGFVNAAWRDLRGLRSDILARYQLRISEFDAWIQAIGSQRG